MFINVTFPSAPTLEVSLDNALEFTTAVGTVVGSANDYEKLDNLPSIEGVTLLGNHTQEELGIRPIGNAAILDLF